MVLSAIVVQVEEKVSEACVSTVANDHHYDHLGHGKSWEKWTLLQMQNCDS